MKIGEFAKRCNTQISVVRHYDKLKLLSPVYIDNFTGYRYYNESQIAIFCHIRKLKEAFKEIEFFENGLCTSVYRNEIISGEKMQTWTKGFVLRKWNRTACAYEIQKFGDTEYLIMEWKSGDYRWGNREKGYYVFVRG